MSRGRVSAQSGAPRFSYPIGLPGRPLGDGFFIRHGYACENAAYYPGLLHTGENWYAIEGNAAGAGIYAVAAGTVVFAGYDYPGRVVIVRHEPDLYSMYGHLEYDLAVEQDQTVERGQLLGTVLARTDDLDRSHLHFEIRTFLTVDAINGDTPRHGFTCGFRCPPGPGYWPIDAPEHPSELGWRNPTHAIARRAFRPTRHRPRRGRRSGATLRRRDGSLGQTVRPPRRPPTRRASSPTGRALHPPRLLRRPGSGHRDRCRRLPPLVPPRPAGRRESWVRAASPSRSTPASTAAPPPSGSICCRTNRRTRGRESRFDQLSAVILPRSCTPGNRCGAVRRARRERDAHASVEAVVASVAVETGRYADAVGGRGRRDSRSRRQIERLETVRGSCRRRPGRR